ncbi:MAG TPA: heme-binding domain-containing protein [Flavipsychrobacter sp.]|nr:heme-binding domain-containing protein [Flavipsychrobacter sp.]
MLRKILIGIVVVLIVIQFFRPEKNQSKDFSKDITTVYTVPEDVQTILKTACYDCHSNYTTYPWYNNFQPMAWWLQSHIKDGKKHLNFSEFAGYTAKKQAHKMEETWEMVEKEEMPLNSYTWTHAPAQLTKEQRTLIIDWARNLQLQIESSL